MLKRNELLSFSGPKEETSVQHAASVWSMFVSYLAYFLTMKMEVICSFETSVDFHFIVPFFPLCSSVCTSLLYRLMWTREVRFQPRQRKTSVIMASPVPSITEYYQTWMGTFADLAGQNWVTAASHRYAITLFWFRINLTVAVAVLKCA
jgi:hypothetical protein